MNIHWLLALLNYQNCKFFVPIYPPFYKLSTLPMHWRRNLSLHSIFQPSQRTSACRTGTSYQTSDPIGSGWAAESLPLSLQSKCAIATICQLVTQLLLLSSHSDFKAAIHTFLRYINIILMFMSFSSILNIYKWRIYNYSQALLVNTQPLYWWLHIPLKLLGPYTTNHPSREEKLCRNVTL